MAKIWSAGLEEAAGATATTVAPPETLRISMRKFRRTLREAGWVRSVHYDRSFGGAWRVKWTSPVDAGSYLELRKAETQVSFRYYVAKDSLDLESGTVALQPVLDKGVGVCSSRAGVLSAEAVLGGPIVIELPERVVQLPRSPWTPLGILESALGPDEFVCLESEVAGLVWPHVEELMYVLKSCG